MHDPEALLVDEPFSGLDPIAVAGLSEIVQEAADQGRLVLFSSHQLDLVEGLCESVAVIDHGRTVMAGRVDDLKAASDARVLRLVVDAHDGDGWTQTLAGARPIASDADGVRLALEPDADPLAVLDHVRRVGAVRDFGLELPSLTELFLQAVDGRR